MGDMLTDDDLLQVLQTFTAARRHPTTAQLADAVRATRPHTATRRVAAVVHNLIRCGCAAGEPDRYGRMHWRAV